MGASFDRRQHLRAGATDFLLTIDSGDTVEVRDVSQAGVCCVVSDPITEMTEVRLKMQVPTRDGDPAKFSCDGAVVRCDRTEDDRYELAIFFLAIDEHYRELIEDYVDSKRGTIQQ